MSFVGPLIHQSGHYVEWPCSDPGFRLTLSVGAAERLDELVTAAVKAVPKRGLEIGGLLLGSARAAEVVVETLGPIDCEYAEGPAFRAPGAGIARVIEEARGIDMVVGIYRSRTDGVLEIDSHDRALLAQLVGLAPLSLLILRGKKNSPTEGRAGVWDGNEVHWISGILPYKQWLRGKRLDAPPGGERVAEAIALRPPPKRRFTRSSSVSLAVVGSAGCLMLAGLLLDEGRSREARGSKTAPPINQQQTVRAVFGEAEVKTAHVLPEQVEASRARSQDLNEPDPGAQSRATREFRSPPVEARAAGVVDTPKTLPDAPKLLASNIAPPRQMSSLTELVHTASGAALPPVSYSPPALLRQTVPVVVPPDLRRLLQHEVVVKLRVSVDRRGRVMSVAAVGNLGLTEEALFRTYEAAVRRWEFEPATRNSAAAAGDIQLNFRVSPAPSGQ